MPIGKEESRKQALETMYNHLLKKYRCEYIYKNFITQKILLGRHSLNTSTLINEFRVGSSVADVVLINGKSTVYEIKTELDNPDRLRDQLSDYQKAFTEIYLVVHYSCIDTYMEKLNGATIGLIALNRRNQLSVRKEAISNINHLDTTTMFKSLRKQEYSNIIKKVYGYVPDVPNMFYFKECLRLAKRMDAVDFNKMMGEELKKRKPKEKEIAGSNKIPDYLRNICLAIDPTRNEYQRLFHYLNQTIH
ncbi:MAG: sce7726 family protein [Balneolaceae bacterium]|nr:sce7726 family protein [Balneolaceae bacterium]